MWRWLRWLWRLWRLRLIDRESSAARAKVPSRCCGWALTLLREALILGRNFRK